MLRPEVKLRSGYLAALIVVCCWSGFNIVSRLGGKSALTPYDLAALRFSVAGLVMLPLFIRVLRDIDRSKLTQYSCIAFFGSLGYALPVYTGFSLAPAAHAGVLVNGGIPFLTAIIAWLALGQKPQGRAALALAIALVGIVMIGLQSFTHLDAGSLQWVGDLCFLYGALSWAIAGLLMRRWQLKPIDTTAMMVGLSAVVYLPIYILLLPKHLGDVSFDALLLQGVYQGVIAATLARAASLSPFPASPSTTCSAIASTPCRAMRRKSSTVSSAACPTNGPWASSSATNRFTPPSRWSACSRLS